MKAAQSILVLLFAAFVIGFPIQILFTDGTPTIRAGNRVIAESKQALTPGKEVRPDFQQYIDRLRQSPSASTAPDPVTTETKTTDSSFLGKFISNDDHPKEALPAKSPANQHDHSNSTKPIIIDVKLADLLDVLDKHGPECVAFGLFVLVPIVYAALELLELTIMACTREEFPRRGRDPVRLVDDPERKLRAWSNRQREMVVASEKRWWQARRGRC